MKCTTGSISIDTRGFTHIVDITKEVAEKLEESGLKEGQVTVFISGSTAAVTTVEYELGLIKDLPEAFEIIAPADKDYYHNAAWGDGNGSAHVRAAIVGGSFTAPFTGGSMHLGTWQQIVVIDFDNRPRHRNITVQIIGI